MEKLSDLLTRLTSRKFLLTLLAVSTALTVAAQDGVFTRDEVWTVIVPILSYLGIEGAADIVGRAKTPPQA